MKKKILIIYNDVPTNNFGGNIRVLELIKNLSLHLDVTLLTLNSNKISLKEISKHCDVVIAKQNLFSKNLFFSLFHVIIRIYYFIIKRLFLWHPKITRVHWYQIYLLRKELSKLLNNNEYDLIQVEHSYLGNVLYKIKSNSSKIISFHNIHSLNDKLNSIHLINLKLIEKKLIKLYDLAVSCSKKDQNFLQNLGFREVVLVPNGANKNKFPVTKFSGNISRIVFFGDLTYEPNKAGVFHFVNKIFPKISRKLNLEIIGKCDESILSLVEGNQNITVHGFIKDLKKVVNDSIFVCPIYEGGGTRIKIFTAMFLGIPIVTSKKGVEGIEAVNGEHLIIAKNDQGFIEGINLLIKNKEKYLEIRNNAIIFVEKYDWKKIYEAYYEKLNFIFFGGKINK